VKVGRYLQTYSKGDLGRASAGLRRARQRPHRHPRRLRRLLELHARWHVVVEGAEPAVPAVDGADHVGRPDHACACSDGLPPPPGVDPNRPASGTTRSIFDINFRDGYAQNCNVNIQQALGTNYALEIAYVGSRGRQMIMKGDPNQAPRSSA
jgi:hypothetical protein